MLSRAKHTGERNRAGDVRRDTTASSVTAAGQTAVDMLFAPATAMTTPPSPLWREMQANAGRFVRNIALRPFPKRG